MVHVRSFVTSLLSLAALSACAHDPAPTAKAPDATALSPANLAQQLEADRPLVKQPAFEERWYANAVMYEVMVRSFADSDGDGIGDLRGLTAHLDYLNTGDPSTTTDLKVNGLWLMPIFKSPSYHGYDATDYYQIDPAYGTQEDFQVFLKEAHRRGIKVMLDLVLNHTSNRHPWFQKAGKAPESADGAWYVWGKSDPGWERPWGGGPTWHSRGPWYYYGLFWEGMPDLNFFHPPVREEMIKIARYWVEQGVDGYRLDAIRYLFEEGNKKQADLPVTHAYLKQLSAQVKSLRPDVAMVGEIWSDTKDVAPYYGNGDELDLAFGFDEANGIKGAVDQGDPARLKEALDKVAAAYPERRFSAPFLSNHDMTRVASDLGSDPAKLRLAASLLLTLPGTPFLYQGEELGLTNGSRPGDEGKRTPMQWDTSPTAGFTTGTPWNTLTGKQESLSVAVQQKDPGSLLHHYQAMIRLRSQEKALRLGAITSVATGDAANPGLLSWQRYVPGQLVVCAFNVGFEPATPEWLALDPEALAASGLVGKKLLVKDLLTGKVVGSRGSANQLEVQVGSLGASSARLLSVTLAP